MSTTTGIEWTDATWNPVVGCERVSPGCAHCYAKQLHDQRHKAHLAGHQMAKQYHVPFENVQLKPERLTAPLGWRTPRRVFVNSVSDLFHDDVSAEYIDKVFAVMALTPWHTYQVLTKRPKRMQEYMLERWVPDHIAVADDRRKRVLHAAEWLVHDHGVAASRFNQPRWWTQEGGLVSHAQPWPLPNVWLGVSVENQRFADERIPILLCTPASVRFLSCEPLLGPVDLTQVNQHVGRESRVTFDALDRHGLHQWTDTGIDWVIVGGESGPNARLMHSTWARALRDQCTAADVSFFFKQWGGRTPKWGGRSLDGREWNEMPGRPSEVTHG
jgi:protein gp37